MLIDYKGSVMKAFLPKVDEKINIRFSVTKMNKYFKHISENKLKYQTVKNLLCKLKKEKQFDDYIALQAAYSKWKIQEDLK